MSKQIVIEDYDPRWPIVFAREKRAILRTLGDRIVAIEHVGSTAVPGLGAKPIVDVMAGLRRLAEVDSCTERLQTIGYAFVPEAIEDLPDDRYFEKWSAGIEVAHLHLTEHGCAFWRDHVLFRDFLREHPEEAAEYERLKRDLAPRYTRGYAYAAAKTDFIRAALARARG